MSGALVDLVAIGVQDTYLTGDPQTTYFRQTYKRYTNFAMEPVRQVIEGDPAAGAWSQVTVTRNGDLLSDLYFLCDSDGDNVIRCPFEEVQLYIGGQKIDTLTDWENVAMSQLFNTNISQRLKTGANPLAATTYGHWGLGFFFCRAFGNALPLCALQYHDVTLRIKWQTGVDATEFSLYGDYVQLDTPERNAFASKPLTMLIEQHQRTPIDAIAAGSSGYGSLEFSHPVKAIYANTATAAGSTLPADSNIKISFNGKTRTPFLPTANYYYDHQVGTHTEYSGGGGSGNYVMYSFALYANRVTPTGSCNFSRLDNARLEVNTSGAILGSTGNIFALNWNFLKIENGMGGLLFAN